MNATARLVYTANAKPSSRFSELDDVRSLRSLETKTGHLIERGTRGTVLGIWADGAAYEVEFGDTIDSLITVAVDDLEGVHQPE